MLEIPINHSPTNVWVNFCWNSYIIALGGSRFFCYGQKKNLDLQKRKLYISIGTKSQKSQGLGFRCRLPGTTYLYGPSFGRHGDLSRQRRPSTSLLPLWSPGGWGPCQRPGWDNAALCQGGRVCSPSSPSPFPPLTPLLKLVPDRDGRQASDPIYNVPSLSNVILRKNPKFPHIYNSKACLTSF